MKKIISLTMSILMATSVIAPCQSVIAQEIELDNILSIGQDISEMCAIYDEDYIDKKNSKPLMLSQQAVNLILMLNGVHDEKAIRYK